MTSAQEESGQQSCTTKELDKSGEVDTAQKCRSRTSLVKKLLFVSTAQPRQAKPPLRFDLEGAG